MINLPQNKPFKLFASCLLTKGISRGTIFDLQRGEYFFVPNSLIDFINQYEGKTLLQVFDLTSKEDSTIVDEYFQFLNENEIIFFTVEELLENFPRIDCNFLYPSLISNCIIDFSCNNFDYLDNLKDQLAVLGCFAISLRFFHKLGIDKIIECLSLFDESSIKSIELHINYNDDYAEVMIEEILGKFPRIKDIFIYSYINIRISNSTRPNGFGNIFYTTNPLLIMQCGVVEQSYFAINIPHYTESLHHNTCLNRKISIDVDGNIKNCPSMKESYGNIRDTTLKEVIEKPGFKKYWNLTKDQIAVCKDCEFRHVCTDCRAYLEDPEDVYSKPLKCGYNPYTCQWEEWSTNPLKQKAIDYYGMREMIINNNDDK